MKILMAVDGSEYSRKAVEYFVEANGFVREHTSIELLYVLVPITGGMEHPALLMNRNEIDHYQKKEAESILAPAEEALRRNGYSVSSIYVVGEAASQIDIMSNIKKVDMIVIGSHGRTALKSLLLGSVATKVLALTQIPVLIIR